MWHVKGVVRSIYEHRDQALAVEFVDRLGRDLQDTDLPVEANELGRTLLRWKDQICAWHASGVSNGPTEAVNNLVKRVKRVAFASSTTATTRSGPCSTQANPTGTYSTLNSVTPC